MAVYIQIYMYIVRFWSIANALSRTFTHSFLSTSYDTLPYFSVFQIKILFLPLNVYIKMRYCLRGTKRFLLTKIYFLCLGLYFPYRSAQKKLRHNSNGWNCVTGKECNQMGRKTFQFCVKPHWNVYDYQSEKCSYAKLCYL